MIIRSAIPWSSTRSRKSFKICACVVTSSAVPGSSAMSSRGSESSAIAIRTRWRMPPDSMIGKDRAIRSGSGMRTCAENLVHPRETRASAPGSAEAAVGVFEDRSHLVADGENRVERGHRVLEHHRHRRPAQGLALARAQAQKIAAVEQDRARSDARGRRRQNTHDRPHRHALATAGLADQRDMPMRGNVERDVAQHLRAAAVGPEIHAERANRQQRVGGHRTLSTS